jgi:hypothetical protein
MYGKGLHLISDRMEPELKLASAASEDIRDEEPRTKEMPNLEMNKEQEVEAEDTARLEVKEEEAESEDDDDRELAHALVPEIKLEEGAVKLEIKQEVEDDDDVDQDGSLGCQSEMYR